MNYPNAYVEAVPVPEAFFTGNYRFLLFGAIWQDPDPKEVEFAQEVNRLAVVTVDAVRNATTKAALLEAIKQRAEFIKKRVEWFAAYIKRKTGQDYIDDTGIGTVSGLLGAIPVPGFSQVGKLVSTWIVRDNVTIAQEDADWAKAEIAKYNADAGDLAKIYKAETATTTSPTDTTADTTSNAPTVSNSTLLLIGAGLLIVILIFLKSRKKRR